MQSYPKEESKFLFPGPIGPIEMHTTNVAQAKGTAIVCHPHPLFGGTMQNKVVSITAKALQNLGFRTVRFNFRGVGETAGEFTKGAGEAVDLLAIIAWVKQEFPQERLYLAGTSFGSYVAARAAAEVSPDYLISIAPAVVNFDFKALGPIHCPWLVIQGDEDVTVDPQAVYAWVDTVKPKPKLIRMPNANHFFHGQLLELRAILEQELAL